MEPYEKPQFDPDRFLHISSDDKVNLPEEDIRVIFTDDGMTGRTYKTVVKD